MTEDSDESPTAFPALANSAWWVTCARSRSIPSPPAPSPSGPVATSSPSRAASLPAPPTFIARLKLRAGDSLLDVACGTGNLAIPAALAGARVTGVDIAPNLIEDARREARAAGCIVDFDVGDAEALPYASGQFDNTVTMFGAMFAYRPDRAASELMRVTRPGGRIAMANWTPEGFVGEMLRAHVAIVPPPPGVPSSLAWGKEDTVRERFGDGVTAITFTRRTIELRFALDPADVPSCSRPATDPRWQRSRPPMPQGARKLRSELTRLFQQHNLADRRHHGGRERVPRRAGAGGVAGVIRADPSSGMAGTPPRAVARGAPPGRACRGVPPARRSGPCRRR